MTASQFLHGVETIEVSSATQPITISKLATVGIVGTAPDAEYVGVRFTLGVPFERRGARTDEWIEVMRALWSDDHVDFDGEFASFAGASVNPKPAGATVPVIIQATGIAPGNPVEVAVAVIGAPRQVVTTPPLAGTLSASSTQVDIEIPASARIGTVQAYLPKVPVTP